MYPNNSSLEHLYAFAFAIVFVAGFATKVGLGKYIDRIKRTAAKNAK